MAGQLAVGLERDVAVRFHHQFARLEVMDVGEFGERAEERAAEITHQREIIHVPEDADIEQPVLRIASLKSAKGPP